MFKVFSSLLHLVILLRLNSDSSLVLPEGMGCSAPHLLASENASAEGLDKIYKKLILGHVNYSFKIYLINASNMFQRALTKHICYADSQG